MQTDIVKKMYVSNSGNTTLGKSMIQSEWLWTLHWHSLPIWGRECFAYCSAYSVCQFFIHDCQKPIAPHTAPHTLHQQNVFESLGASRSVWEDVECKYRCVNFRRVSDPRRAFLLACKETRSVCNKLGSVDNKPGNTWERWRQTWGRRQQVWEHLESQQRSPGKITSSLARMQVRLNMISTTYRSTIIKTHVFSFDSHLCTDIVTHLHTVYLDCLQAVLESNSRFAWKWRSSEPRDTLQSRDGACWEIHLKAATMRTWRP